MSKELKIICSKLGLKFNYSRFSKNRIEIPLNNLQKLPKEFIKCELEKIKTKVANRKVNNGDTISINFSKKKSSLNKKRESEYIDYPYSVPNSKWVDNTFKMVVSISDKNRLDVYKYKKWSSNGKWNSNAIKVEIQKTGNTIIKNIGGMLTFYNKYEKLEKRVIPCIWYVQGRAMDDLNKIEGFLINGTYHFEGTEKEAKKLLKEVIKKANEKKKLLKEKVISIDYCKTLGFCDTGIKNFMSINNLEGTEISFMKLQKLVKKNLDKNLQFKSFLSKLGIEL